jgi:hypothetical protein
MSFRCPPFQGVSRWQTYENHLQVTRRPLNLPPLLAQSHTQIGNARAMLGRRT